MNGLVVLERFSRLRFPVRRLCQTAGCHDLTEFVGFGIYDRRLASSTAPVRRIIPFSLVASCCDDRCAGIGRYSCRSDICPSCACLVTTTHASRIVFRDGRYLGKEWRNRSKAVLPGISPAPSAAQVGTVNACVIRCSGVATKLPTFLPGHFPGLCPPGHLRCRPRSPRRRWHLRGGVDHHPKSYVV